jgi:hypothetical protein
VGAAAIAIVLALGLVVSACTGAGSATPGPSASAGPGAGGDPSASPSAGEAELIAGVRSDLAGTCVPFREALPGDATAAISCTPVDQPVERVTLYLFDAQPAMLDAYARWVGAHGITPRSHGGSCLGGGPSEGAYIPGGDVGGTMPERSACQVDATGSAQYAVTLPPFVLATAESGPGGDMAAVETWTWLGNQDTPGGPTVWNASGPMSPEK